MEHIVVRISSKRCHMSLVRYNVHRYESNTNLCCIGIINIHLCLEQSQCCRNHHLFLLIFVLLISIFFPVWRTVLLQGRAGTASMAQVRTSLHKELDGIKEAGTWKGERIITSKQGPSIHVQGSKNDILNFCANNYLGLSVSVSSQ